MSWPHEIHPDDVPQRLRPMEAVWALCRQWDDRANCGAGTPRPRPEEDPS